MRVQRIAHHAVVSAWRERERALIAQGHRVDLVSATVWNEGGHPVTLSADGDDFVRPARTWGTHPNGFVYSPGALWRALGTEVDVLDLHEEPYALATAEVLALRALRRRRAPYVLYSAQNIDKRFPAPFRWAERRALRGAAGAYVCNAEAGRILRRKGLRGPVHTIPLGVDTTVFAPVDRSAPRGRATVGYVGRLATHKGVDVLLRAIAAQPLLRLVIVGDGPERAALADLARALSIAERVDFVGFAADSALVEHYRSFDVVAVPSRSTPNWLEQFGRVAIEAMACGVPVVATHTGALPDVVGAAGVLVPEGDAHALGEALVAATRPGYWEELRTAGLQHAARCDWASVAAQMAELYTEARESAPRTLDAVIVAYGAPDGLDATLTALDGQVPALVVDNSSLPATRDVCERHGIEYVDAGSNLGFAAGVNRGLRALAEHGRAGDVLLLNPDATIGAEAVAEMHRLLSADRNLAAVGAHQVDPVSRARARVWWPFPTPWGAWVEAMGLGRLRTAHGFAIGSVLLLRREALDALGALDERFFLYAEEVDWQRRARRAGWAIAVADVEATHVGAGTGGDPGAREAYFYGSAERYIRKHYRAWGWQVYRAATVTGATVRALLLRGARAREAARRRRIFVEGPQAWERQWR
ncbi:glycosyltransferase [Demequina aestuarii]|uniref:glycosyltransferase n=1 Tax=Demequina aestuarii TaxID=327095 RepID=UPI0007802876|nr:glycosyltransferase [Demequina aestuarii]